MDTSRLPLQLTASAIRDFQECPYRYALLHVSPLDPRERNRVRIFTFGEIIHAAIADFFRCGGWDSVSLDELLLILESHWRDDIYEDEAIAAANHQRAQELMTRFYQARYPRGPVHELDIERRLSWPRYHNGLLISGRIDRIVVHPNQCLELIDYKSSQRVLSRADVQADPQALFYRSLACQYQDLQPTRILVTFFYLPARRPVTIDYSGAEFRACWRRVEGLVEQIRVAMTAVMGGSTVSQAFPARPGVRCQFCLGRSTCSSAIC